MILPLLESVITLGKVSFFRRLGYESGGMPRVAAGDPSLTVTPKTTKYEIPRFFHVDGQEMKGEDFNGYLVTGNSMLPKGIADGDYLLVKKNIACDYAEGDFLIIQVDKNYYKKYNPKTVIFDYKLRRALLCVTKEMSDVQIIDRLKNTHFEINIESNQKYMARKHKEARSAYPDDDLMLSTTYHDGRLCYSFHPKRLIFARAAVLVHMKAAAPEYKLL